MQDDILNSQLSIGRRKIGDGCKVFIIAELSANHRQKFELAVKSIKAIKECGADAVKLQTFTPDTITIDSNRKYFQIKQGTIWDGLNLYQLYKKAYLPWEWQPKLKKIAENLGLICFSSVNDRTAVDFLEKHNFSAYKLPSFEITDIPLIGYIAQKNKPIIFSTGVSNLADIKEALLVCKKNKNNQIAVLKCTSAYPAPFEEVNLNTIPDLKKRFKTVVGLSDHTLGISVPIAAVALGAKIIEKHFILDKKLRGPDASFSLEPQEFKEMVKSIRQVEKALGKVNYNLTKSTKRGREFARSLFVVKDINAGELLTEENVRSIRPGFGLAPKYYRTIIGRKVKRDIKRGMPLKWENIRKER